MANTKQNQGTQANINPKRNQGTQANINADEGFAGPNKRSDVHAKVADFLKQHTCYKRCRLSFKTGNNDNRLKILKGCKKDIDTCDKLIGVLDLGIQLEDGGYHANMVIIYKDTLRLLHLEPHGLSKYNILDLLRETWPGYQVTNPTAACPVQGGLPWCRIYSDLYALTLVEDPSLANNPEQIREEVRDITSNVDVLEAFMEFVRLGSSQKLNVMNYKRMLPGLKNFRQKHMAAIRFYTEGNDKGLSKREKENIKRYSDKARPVMMPADVEPTDEVYRNMEALYAEWQQFMENQQLAFPELKLTPWTSRARKYNMQVRSMLNMERTVMSQGFEGRVIPFNWQARKRKAERHLQAIKEVNSARAKKATSNLHNKLGGRTATDGVLQGQT